MTKNYVISNPFSVSRIYIQYIWLPDKRIKPSILGKFVDSYSCISYWHFLSYSQFTSNYIWLVKDQYIWLLYWSPKSNRHTWWPSLASSFHYEALYTVIKVQHKVSEHASAHAILFLNLIRKRERKNPRNNETHRKNEETKHCAIMG